MNKIVYLIPIVLLSLSLSVFAHDSKNDKQIKTAIGTIISSDFQGNTYLKLTVKTSKDNKDILIWCSTDKTKVYASKKAIPWTKLVSGRKIKVVGNWIEEEGEKLLWASKIDLL